MHLHLHRLVVVVGCSSCIELAAEQLLGRGEKMMMTPGAEDLDAGHDEILGFWILLMLI